jgi:hypothetical protein
MLENKSTDAMPIPHSPAWTTKEQVFQQRRENQTALMQKQQER